MSPDAKPTESAPSERSLAMSKALGALLDRVNGSRDALPLMAALERSLQTQGLKCIDNASTGAMSRIASQLATLPAAESDTAMHDLQAYLLARLAPPEAPPPRFKPSFVSTDSLEVSEGSMTDFLSIQQGQMPAPR